MFLKSKAKMDWKKLSKSRYSTQFQVRFVRGEKSLVKISAIRKKDLSIPRLWKESASILEQASRSYGDLKLGFFVTK